MENVPTGSKERAMRTATGSQEILNPPNKERWHGDVEDPLHHNPEGGLDNPFMPKKVVDNDPEVR